MGFARLSENEERILDDELGVPLVVHNQKNL